MGANGGSAGGPDTEGRALLVDARATDGCAELLGPPSESALNLLLVTVDGDAAGRLSAIRDHGHPLDRVRVVTVGASAAPEASAAPGADHAPTPTRLEDRPSPSGYGGRELL